MALSLLFVISGCKERWTSDRSGAAALKTIMTAQQDFRSEDRDEDGKKNYWVKDVAGLYGLDPGNGPIKLIDKKLAQTDRTPGRDNYGWVMEKKSYIGYHFSALERYQEAGKSVPYDDGTGHNPSRYGLVIFPAVEDPNDDALGILTYITNEQSTIYGKDTGGKPVWDFPEDPVAEGWKVYK